MPLITEEQIKTNIEELSTNPNVWMAIGKWLLTVATAIKPLKDVPTNEGRQDLTRHTLLCSAYTEYLSKKNHPIEWSLNADNTPTYHPNFLNSVIKMREYCSQLNNCHSSMKNNIIAAISLIEQLYKVLSGGLKYEEAKKIFDINYTRSDGFEAMFFNELAMWLMVDFASYDLNFKETPTLIKKRIDYCEHVKEHILVYRGDKNTVNPKSQLSYIIQSLNSIHSDVCELQKGISFSNRIDQITSFISNMTRNTFNLLYSMHEKTTPTELIVAALLNVKEKDTNIQSFKKSKIGEWVITTLRLLDITENNFKKDKDTRITLSEIESHLASDFSNLDQSNPNSYGLVPFATKEQNKGYLKLIILTLRELLKLYYAADSLPLVNFKVQELGQSCLYGDDDSKDTITSCLCIIEHASENLHIMSSALWNTFYVKDYKNHAQEKQTDDGANPIYARLLAGNTAYTQINNNHTLLVATKTTIETDIKKLSPKEQDEIIKQKNKLLIDILHSYSSHSSIGVAPVSLTDPLKAISLDAKNTISRLYTSFQSIPQQPLSAQRPVALECKALIKDMPIYTLARDHFNGKRLVEKTDYVLTSKPIKFHSLMHKKLYETFLTEAKKVHAWNTGIWWLVGPVTVNIQLGWRGKTDDFCKEYAKINGIMKQLYSNSKAPTELEIKAINWYLQKFMQRIADNCYKISHVFINDSSVLALKEEGDYLVITQNTEYMNDTTTRLTEELKQKDIKIKGLEKELGSSKKETKAAQDETKAAQDEAKTAQHAAKAAKDETKAAKDETKAAKDETKAAKDETKAAQDKAKAAQDKAKAAQDKAKAAQDETKAAKDETKAAKDETKAAQHATKAAQDEATNEKTKNDALKIELNSEITEKRDCEAKLRDAEAKNDVLQMNSKTIGTKLVETQIELEDQLQINTGLTTELKDEKNKNTTATNEIIELQSNSQRIYKKLIETQEKLQPFLDEEVELETKPSSHCRF